MYRTLFATEQRKGSWREGKIGNKTLTDRWHAAAADMKFKQGMLMKFKQQNTTHFRSEEQLFVEFHKLSTKITAAGVQPGLIHLLLTSLVGGEVATQSSLLKIAPCILYSLATLLQSIAGSSLQRHSIELRPLVLIELIT